MRIYDLRDRALACVIGAHARWINALELHPTKDLFATASEDAHVSVWKIPDEQARPLKHVATLPLPDHVLTGVAFCGGGGRDARGGDGVRRRLHLGVGARRVR